MARFYDVDRANARIPELRDILELLRDQRAELIRLRDLVLERQSAVEAGAESGLGSSRSSDDDGPDDELRLIRLRMQGLIDQMQAARHRIGTRRFPGARERPPDLALLAARGGRGGLVARAVDGLLRTPAAHRPRLSMPVR
jgi:hypothetical protein